MNSGVKFVLRRCRDKRAKALEVTLLALFVGISSNTGSAQVKLVKQSPLSVLKLPDGDYLLDFGRVAFGNLLLIPDSRSKGKVTFRFGEAMRNGRIDR